MQRFIARQNVIHYRQLLEIEKDPQARERIERLLEEAVAQLAAADQSARDSSPPPHGGRPPPSVGGVHRPR